MSMCSQPPSEQVKNKRPAYNWARSINNGTTEQLGGAAATTRPAAADTRSGPHTLHRLCHTQLSRVRPCRLTFENNQTTTTSENNTSTSAP